MNPSGSLEWREVVDKHAAALVDELTARIDSDLEYARVEASLAAVEAATEKERALAAARIEIVRETTAREIRLAIAESLNQTLRRIRQSSTQAAALEILLESTAACAEQAVVLEVENNHARSLAVRGSETEEFAFSLETSPAVASVCESRDPLVALATENDLSPELARVFSSGGDTGQKTYLFPVIARQKVIAVLVVGSDPISVGLVPSLMELLSEATGLKIEALQAESSESPVALQPLPNSHLVQILPPSVRETVSAEKRSWSDLSPEDQKLHLQAQRVARVKVAEMRLYHADELRKGVAESNIYGLLSSEIDRARADFLQTFLSKSRTMVDYLHIEIVRSLAHDEDGLLGPEYPGPMV